MFGETMLSFGTSVMTTYHYYNSYDVHKHTLCDEEYVTNCLVLPFPFEVIPL